jgi:hypothetical protein
MQFATLNSVQLGVSMSYMLYSTDHSGRRYTDTLRQGWSPSLEVPGKMYSYTVKFLPIGIAHVGFPFVENTFPTGNL